MTRASFIVALLALLLGAGASAHAAGERPKLAVVPFQGPQAKKAEGAVVRALRKRAQIIPSSAWKRASKKLFSTTHSSEDIAAVADDLGAQVVITGLVKKDGHHYELSVALREGKSGKTRSRLKYPMPSPKIPASVLTLLSKEVLEAFDTAVSGAPEPVVTTTTRGPQSSAPPAAAPPPPAPPPTRTQAAAPPPARNPDTELPPRAGEPPPPPPPPPPSSTATPAGTRSAEKLTSGRPRWAPYFDVTLGLSISGRSFVFDPNSQPRFASGIVPGIHADVTLYPLAFTWNKLGGVFSGLGVGGFIDKPFWPDSTSKQDPNQRFATSELRFEGGLRWRIVLYKPMPRPQLLIQANYGFHSFSLGKDASGQDVGPADVTYKYFSVGAGFRIHFAEWMYLWAMFNYHVVLDSGPISVVATEYGPANAFGIRISGGLDFFVYKGIKLGAEGFYERFGLQFNPGTLMPAKAANSGLDQYFGGFIVVGYVL